MRAALWTVFLVVLPGIWFVRPGEALTWFSEGEPPRLLRPLVRRLRPHAERLRAAPAGAAVAPCRSRCRRCCSALELRRLGARSAGRGRRRRRTRPRGCGPCSRPTTSCSSSCASGSRCPTDGVGLPPLPSRERLTLEAELVAAGHDW